MSRILIALAILVLSETAVAQESTFSGKVFYLGNHHEEVRVPGVFVSCDETGNYDRTNHQGFYELPWFAGDNKEVTLRVEAHSSGPGQRDQFVARQILEPSSEGTPGKTRMPQNHKINIRLFPTNEEYEKMKRDQEDEDARRETSPNKGQTGS
jgi:hypothetical protein